ncbi:MAG TPA: ribosome maturation factor RimM [Polyangiaceae bacterium]
MEYIEVARIIKPHGLGGEVGVLMHWAGSEVLQEVSAVQLQLGDGTVVQREISRVRASGRGFLVKFAGVNDRDSAELLRDARISVERSQLAQPAPGETFLADLIGMPVHGPDATLLGRVIDVASYPSVDALVIERADGSQVEQPWVDAWVEPIDPDAHYVQLRSLDGLVEA